LFKEGNFFAFVKPLEQDSEPAKEYLIKADNPEILKYFIERRLWPLTLTSDDDKLIEFDDIREIISIFP